MNLSKLHPAILLFIFAGCSTIGKSKRSAGAIDPVTYSKENLPAPYSTKSKTRFSKVVGWPKRKSPVAPAGFSVSRFADHLNHPRWIYVAPNGDIFVAESNTVFKGIKRLAVRILPRIKSQDYGKSANRIILFRDVDKDGTPDQRFVFTKGLNQPLGMLASYTAFYICNTDGVMKFSYTPGDTALKDKGQKILSLPAGGYNNHWTRNIISNDIGTKLYITVGSGSNVGEHGIDNEIRRANIIEINTDGSGERIYASGLRNPVGMDWAPGTQTLWTVVNERDNLGDDLVPDYLTSVKEGGFYGWPYSYYGQNAEPRMMDHNRPDLIAKAIVPDVSLGAHTASLGLAFYNKKSFPSKYYNGAFIGQHGSWNRSTLSGYKVVFLPFVNGRPSGQPEDFLTGFIADQSKAKVYGRPVGVAVLPNGSLLVADDVSNVIWKVSANKR